MPVVPTWAKFVYPLAGQTPSEIACAAERRSFSVVESKPEPASEALNVTAREEVPAATAGAAIAGAVESFAKLRVPEPTLPALSVIVTTSVGADDVPVVQL